MSATVTLPELSPSRPNPGESATVSQQEAERLLAELGMGGGTGGAPTTDSILGTNGKTGVRRHDFPKLSPLTAMDLRPLRVRHEEFMVALGTRLSLRLGSEVGLQMSKLDAMRFSAFTESLADPTYLTLLKIAPLKGTCLIDIPMKLGLSLVDRELGGSGAIGEETGTFGKIEERLLSPLVELIINEWCTAWHDVMEIRPTVQGHESNSRYLATSEPGDTMLVVGLQITLGPTVENVHLAFPHSMIEPLTVKLSAMANSGEKRDSAAAAAPAKWNPLFSAMKIDVRAELPPMEYTAAEVAALQPGDVLPLPRDFMSRVQVRLGDRLTFVGVLGSSETVRAVKIEGRAANQAG